MNNDLVTLNLSIPKWLYHQLEDKAKETNDSIDDIVWMIFEDGMTCGWNIGVNHQQP